MLLCGFEPGLKLSHGRPVGPALIPVPGRCDYHPGNMARAGNNKRCGPCYVSSLRHQAPATFSSLLRVWDGTRDL
jgi:hypothetical protein